MGTCSPGPLILMVLSEERQSRDAWNPWILPEDGLSYGETVGTEQKSHLVIIGCMPKDRHPIGSMDPRLREEPGR